MSQGEFAKGYFYETPVFFDGSAMITRDLPLLIDAICEGWTKCLVGDYGDGTFSSAIDGMTDCNQFVNYVCQRLGYTKFVPAGQRLPILANQMVDYMLENHKEWWELSGLATQQFANLGVLILAGWKNPSGGHGHVCVVRPGKLTTSEKWSSSDVPKVANVSVPSLCRIDRGSNYAFSNPPAYFALKEMMP